MGVCILCLVCVVYVAASAISCICIIVCDLGSSNEEALARFGQ